jgi:hypothetical protein
LRGRGKRFEEEGKGNEGLLFKALRFKLNGVLELVESELDAEDTGSNDGKGIDCCIEGESSEERKD